MSAGKKDTEHGWHPTTRPPHYPAPLRSTKRPSIEYPIPMKRWFALLLSLPLMGCKTSSKQHATSPLPVRVTTALEAKNAGLTSSELADLESFYDYVHSDCRTGQYRIDPSFTREERAELRRIISKRFAKPSDPHFMLLENEHQLMLGLALSASSHRLHVLAPSKLALCDDVSFERCPSGYDITHINGCIVTPIKIVKNRGRPFIITIDHRD